MEKILNLLNDYAPDYCKNYPDDIIMDEIVISKRFGFVEWLCSNDKIDLETQAMQYAKSDLSKFFAEWKDRDGMSDDYAMLLMLLAIQNNPIEFLLSILR